MDKVCFALPILPSKTDAARAFMHELETARAQEYAASERRIGMEREFWFLQHTDQGDTFVAFMESPDIRQAFETFIVSKDPFDSWFKNCLLEVTGLDLNSPPEGPLSELLSSYDSTESRIAH